MSPLWAASRGTHGVWAQNKPYGAHGIYTWAAYGPDGEILNPPKVETHSANNVPTLQGKFEDAKKHMNNLTFGWVKNFANKFSFQSVGKQTSGPKSRKKGETRTWP